MKKRFTFLIAALMLLTMTNLPEKAVGQTYSIATSIAVGDVVVLVNANVKKELSGISTSSYGTVEDTENDTPSGLYPLTVVAGNTDGSFAFKTNNNKYLTWNSGNTLTTANSITKASSWNVGFDANQIATITNVNTSGSNTRYLQYNASSSRFACYKSTSLQANGKLYKLEASTDPSCEVSPAFWAIGNVQAGSSTQTQSFTVTAANLTAGLSFAIENGTYYSITNGVTGMNSNETSKTIDVTFNPTNVGDMNDYLVISGTDFSGENAIRVPITAHGLCNAPTYELSYTTPVNLTLTGDDISTTLTPVASTGNGGAITYSLISGDDNHATVANTGYFYADATGQYVVRATQALNGTTCGGEFDITINVTGTEPVCTIDPTTYNFGTVLTGSTNTQDFTVTTANLEGDLTVSIDNADKGFSVVSPSPATIAQNATSTTVTVQYAPTTASSEVTATLTISGDGITQTATVKGTASDGNTITFDAGTGTCETTSVTNLPGYVFTLPTVDDITAPEGWEFAGWCATEVPVATSDQPELLSGSYTITTDVTLYAVYKIGDAPFDNTASGNYLIYATVNDVNYYATGDVSSSTLQKTTDINEANVYTFEKQEGNGVFTIKNGDKYLAVSGDNLISQTTSFNWTITAQSGSWKVAKSGTTRALIYRAGTQNVYKNYATSNVNNTEYFYVKIGVKTPISYHTSPIPQVAIPTIEVTAGVPATGDDTYYHTANVTLSCDTDGAAIHYTTNGNDPTASSATYTGPFSITETATIKAIAVKTNYNDSEIAEKEITIVEPNTATFTNGEYNSLSSVSEFNTWYKYTVTGEAEWSWISSYAKCTQSGNNEAWLISPQMAVENGKLAISFDWCGRWGAANQFEAYYSTDYIGYGNPDPTTYTWTKIDSDLPYIANDWIFTKIEEDLTVADGVYLAFVYKATTSNSGALEVKSFTAKQCYPVTYNKNGGGDGTMAEDPNSPYAVGATVTVLACDFTAPEKPENMEFVCWSTQADGNGDKYYPGTDNNTFTMGTSAVELFAIWAQACTTDPEMAATTNNNEYVNDGGAKSWTINLGSSITSVGTGGCEISEYGFVYSTAHDTPTTSDTKITLDIPGGGVSAGDIEATITGATASTTYYVRSYAINNHGTGYGALATITTNAFPKYQIDYYINSTTKSYSKEIYQGDAITATELPDESESAPEGFTFMGWKSSVIDGVQNDPPTYVAVDDVLEANSSFYAVFAIAGTGETEQNLEMTATNFTELGASYGKYTHTYTDVATIEVYSCKQSSAFQINKSKGVYFKNTSAMPGYITKFVIAWDGTPANNTITMYANSNSVASTSSTNVGAPSAGASQTITIENASTNNYKYFYMDPETVSGGCKISSFKIYYMGTGTIYSNFCTSVKSISGYENIDEETGRLTDDVIVTEGVFYVDEIITVPNGTKLEIKGTGALISPVAENLIIEDGGQLILPDDASVQATVKNSTAASTETKTYDIQWNAISSPVDNVVVTSFVKGDTHNVYRYDEKTVYWQEYRGTNGFNNLQNGRGYIYRSTESGIEFQGEVITGTVSCADYLSYACDNNRYIGFNLIGNPFTHDITWSNLTTKTNISSAGFFLLGADGNWSAQTNSGTIAPMQAFLVQATEESPVIKISNTAGKGDDRYGNDQIQFTVNNSEYSDVAYAIFREGHGLNKIEHRNDNIPMLYIINDDKDYAIAEMPDNTNVINLGFKARAIGQYTLSLNAEGRYSYMHLYDKLTGSDVDMLLDNSYTFVGSPSDRNDRFVLRLNYNAANIDTESDIFAYQNGADIIISGTGELQIFDIMGHQVSTQRINGVETINVSTQGVYILRLVGTEIKTQKIVVR